MDMEPSPTESVKNAWPNAAYAAWMNVENRSGAVSPEKSFPKSGTR